MDTPWLSAGDTIFATLNSGIAIGAKRANVMGAPVGAPVACLAKGGAYRYAWGSIWTVCDEGAGDQSRETVFIPYHLALSLVTWCRVHG